MDNEAFRKLLNSDNLVPRRCEDGPTKAHGTSRLSSNLRLHSRRTSFQTQLGNVKTPFPSSAHLLPRQVEQTARDHKKEKLPSQCPEEEQQETEEDEIAQRVRALDDSLRAGDIDKPTYNQRRAEIAGGDLASTHLVNGLDFKLLERIRKGEDVYRSGKTIENQGSAKDTLTSTGEKHGEMLGSPEQELDISDATFDELARKEVKPVERHKTSKQGEVAPAHLVPGKKRTRNEILAELKAAHAAAAAAKKAAEEASSSRAGFKKISEKAKPGTSRIERDSRGREVLIIVDEDGHERRRVRKLPPTAMERKLREKDEMASMPDPNAKPLGMEVPEIYKKQMVEKDEVDDDKDIFAGAGDDYNPLPEDSSDDERNDTARSSNDQNKSKVTVDVEHITKDDRPQSVIKTAEPTRVNYFAHSKTKLLSEEQAKAPSLSDPTIVAALKKAAKLRLAETSAVEDEVKARELKLCKMIERDNRDAEDLDMGFGTSRFEDERDMEIDEKGIKLFSWDGDDDEEDGDSGAKKKRKRGPKKRKGDPNNAADVLKIIESRKQKPR